MKYELIRSLRKTIAIQVYPDGRIVVRAPTRMNAADIQRFVDEKTPWIEKHLERAKTRQCDDTSLFTADELHRLAQDALADIPKRVEHFAPIAGVTVGKIAIRTQRTRWGSCSSKGNLNFNCLLMLCPEEVRNYVVVHELCHRIELNHSSRFWQEVERILPDYRVHRRWLKEHGSALISRLG